MQNTLVGAGIRDQFKIGASGKMVTASAMARSMAMGADWCNSARAFMFAVGCIQSQRCHTNQCPVGVTTQDPKLQRALIVAGQGRARAPLPPQHGARPGRVDRRDGAGPHQRAAAAPRRTTGHPVPGAGLDEIYDLVKPNAAPRRHRTRALPGLLGPGIGRVLPPLVRHRAGRAAAAAAS